jgi:very-short-patch-repair endonuclease
MQSSDGAREMRRNPTKGERLLWMALRNRTLGKHKFRRQCPIGPFIVDFVCFDRRLVVEVDGITHDFNAAYDERRDRWFRARGFRVARFPDEEVIKNLDGVVASIREFCRIA